VGLANTRERLEAMYGPRADFSLSNAEGGGLRVRMEIPVDGPWTEE
jgi:sensor histidine kinase YesM